MKEGGALHFSIGASSLSPIAPRTPPSMAALAGPPRPPGLLGGRRVPSRPARPEVLFASRRPPPFSRLAAGTDDGLDFAQPTSANDIRACTCVRGGGWE